MLQVQFHIAKSTFCAKLKNKVILQIAQPTFAGQARKLYSDGKNILIEENNQKKTIAVSIHGLGHIKLVFRNLKLILIVSQICKMH